MKKLNAVYIQPTYDCALNCKGCYVKESTQHEQMNKDTLESLIRTLWITERFWINQITLAVDDIPDDSDTRDKMVGALRTALRMRSLYGNRIEFHITVNSAHTLDKYIDSGLSLEYIAKHVDLLSVSHLTVNDAAFIARVRQHTKVNYNYTPTYGLKGYRNVLKLVDMSYYLLHKAGLGKKNHPGQIRLFKEGLKLLESWSSEDKQKVIIDGCIKDAFKFRATGFGCSAGISRIHIWPDGHSSGCPYNRNGGPANSTTATIFKAMDKILCRFHTAYEFGSCTIPEDYSYKAVLHVIR